MNRPAVRRTIALLGLLGLALLMALPCEQGFAQDHPAARTTVFVNGRLFTAEANAPYAEAIAVRDDQILAVGQRESVVIAAGPGARIVDLDGRERMPREAMLYAYTRNAALALGQLQNIGTLAPGKRADLVLVDRDILAVSSQELRETKVIWTMFGGKVVYGRAP